MSNWTPTKIRLWCFFLPESGPQPHRSLSGALQSNGSQIRVRYPQKPRKNFLRKIRGRCLPDLWPLTLTQTFFHMTLSTVEEIISNALDIKYPLLWQKSEDLMNISFEFCAHITTLTEEKIQSFDFFLYFSDYSLINSQQKCKRTTWTLHSETSLYLPILS